MNDLDYADWAKTLTESELLDEVMENPEYLTDGYYRYMCVALVKRYNELREDK